MNRTRYEDDLVAWTQEQADLLRAGDLDAIDREHLAEEIESVGASQRRELRRRLSRLLQHLLKWHYQPELRSRSWSLTIRVQRDEIAGLLEESPSLRSAVDALLPQAWRLARAWAVEETGLLALPEACPWTPEQILSPDGLPA